jgi:oligopeptide transport system substrate-binding protein
MAFMLVFGMAGSPQGVQARTVAATDLPNTLRINAGAYPDIMDPQKSSFVNELGPLKLFYEGLTRLDANLNTVPGAAESWQYNADATQIEFTLRPGLQYSDGTGLNAKRFEYSILRALDPYTAGEYASLLDDITGGYEYRTADLAVITPPELQALRDAVQVKAYDMLGAPCTGYSQVNCRVLRVGLRQSTPHFHSIASMALFYPAKEELINSGGDNWWNSSLYQIGNGPFVLKTLEPFVRSYYTPNPHYWRGQPGYNIEFQYIEDSSLALQAYQAGLTDVMPVTADIAGAVGGDPILLSQLKTYNGSCSYMVAYHNLKPPFNNQHVREAFSYAIDREAWVEDVLSGNGLPTLTWIPQGFPGYDANETRWDYNPTAALQALAAGGYTVANGELIGPDAQPIPIIDTFTDTPRNRTRHQWLIDQWYEVLGIQVQFNPVDYATYNGMVNGDISVKPPIYIFGWCADYPDPQNWLSVYWKGTSSFAQRFGYNNSTLDAMLTEADSTIDPVLRLQRYTAAQQMLIGDAPATFLWNSILTYLVKPRVIGEISTPMDNLWPGEMDPLTIQLGYPMYLPAIIKAPLPTNDIVFVSYRDGNGELYSMRSDGSNEIRLTNTANLNETSPVWSPDGKKIAYVTADSSYNRKIYVMNSDGTGVTYLTDGYDPDWSPDGQKLVFATLRDGNAEIYVMAANGSNLQRLTIEPQSDSMPSWSPDGSTIVFHSERFYVYDAIFPGLFRMDPNGANVTSLIADLYAENPDWCSNGTKLTLEGSEHVDGVPLLVREIYVHYFSGTGPGKLTYPPEFNYDPSWSPDCSKIAFTSSRDGNGEIYTMNADGTSPVRITNNSFYDGQPNWK